MNVARSTVLPKNGGRWTAREGIILVVFLAGTCLAYLPTFSAGFAWDDPDYVLNNRNLVEPGGLWRTWFEPRSSPQYYPVVFTSFWIEWRLWQDWAPGYHATNVVLHALGGFLLWRVLSSLRLPGALLAAALWTLHPVQVESVAWITERKNTLSAVFYFASALALLRSPGGIPSPRSPRWWAGLGWFLLALLSKSVTASLPAAVLLVRWWQKDDRLVRTTLRLLPFFLAGAMAGLHTSFLERDHVGAVGHEWRYAETAAGELVARVLIAGRAIVFYLAKLLWPMDLAFMYERWVIDPRAWWQWPHPLGVVAVTITLWALRHRIGRGPITAALFFVGTLFPALGFFNVYPHRYSFVADHFQHLASVGPLALLAAGFTLLGLPRSIHDGVTLALLLLLGTMTFRQARDYDSALTLWEATASRSPRAWVAWSNLGKIHADAGRIDDAILAHEVAWALEQRVPDTWYNLAMVRARQGRFDEARTMLLRALELTGEKSVLRLDCLVKLSMLDDEQGRADEARRWIDEALRRAPDYAPAIRWDADLRRRGR